MRSMIGIHLVFVLFAVNMVDSMYLGQNWGNILNAERIEQPRCVSIPQNFSLCHGIQYDLMRLPNLLDHETLDEAIQQSDAWNSLLRLHCHPETKLFLCSVFAPVCVPEMEKPIYPCKSLCRAVQKGCESRMSQYGFSWPEILDCSNYPEDNDMCIKKPEDNDQSTVGDSSNSHSRMFPSQFGLTSGKNRILKENPLKTNKSHFESQIITSTPLSSSISTKNNKIQTTKSNAVEMSSVRSQFDSTSIPSTVDLLYSNTNMSMSTMSNNNNTDVKLNIKSNQNDTDGSDSKRECNSCSQVSTYENILDHFCGSNLVFKAKVRQHNATHLTLQRVQRVFKPASNGRPSSQQMRTIQINDSHELDCQCPAPSNGKSMMSGNYLVMSNGAITDQKITARLIIPWQQKDKIFKSAIRKFRKVNCRTLGREIRESVLKQSRQNYI